MQDLHVAETGAFAALLSKFLPAGLGAAIMMAVDPPSTKRDLFTHAFVAFAASYLFGDVAFDLLQSLSWFSFLDGAKRAHGMAVDGFVGAVGWSVFGGISMWLRKFRNDPVDAFRTTKEAIKK